jgi:hypothetical protein
MRAIVVLSLGLACVACSSPPRAPAVAFPASLAAFGNGFPHDGDPCRRLGASPATNDYLDDTMVLVGCPHGRNGPEARSLMASQRGASFNAEADGFALISVPNHDPFGGA